MNLVERESIVNLSITAYPKAVHERCSDAYAMNHLINAALVDKRFCELLLKNPSEALAQGYYGEQFALPNKERQFVLSVGASSLPEFAERWLMYSCA